MANLQLLYAFLIDSIGNVPIDVLLLLHRHHLIIESFLFLDSRLDSLLRLFLQRLVVCSLNGKTFVLSQVRMLQLLLVELHLNLLHPLGIVKEILFPLGIGDTIQRLFPLFPFSFSSELVFGTLASIPISRATSTSSSITIRTTIPGSHIVSLVRQFLITG